MSRSERHSWAQLVVALVLAASFEAHTLDALVLRLMEECLGSCDAMRERGYWMQLRASKCSRLSSTQKQQRSQDLKALQALRLGSSTPCQVPFPASCWQD